jgi:hypothetical protein
MERTVWIAALALAVTASVSCKDSNRNYISFDASPTQTTDAKSDLPPAADGAASDVASDHGSSSSDSSASDVAADHGAPSSDAQASDALADTALAQDTASDGTSSDATGSDTAVDAIGNDGGDGQ